MGSLHLPPLRSAAATTRHQQYEPPRPRRSRTCVMVHLRDRCRIIHPLGISRHLQCYIACRRKSSDLVQFLSQLVFTTMSLETYDLALSHFVWIRGARRRQKANRRSHLGAFNPHLTGPAAETFGTSLSTFVYWCVFICVFLFIYIFICVFPLLDGPASF